VSDVRFSPLFNGLYMISSDGRLYSVRSNKYLKPNTDKYGYYTYTFSINSVRYTYKAHRLVATAFIPNPENKPTVNHIDCNKRNNTVENLEWATHKEQSHHPPTFKKLMSTCTKRNYVAMGEKINFNRRRTFAYKDGVCYGVFDSLLLASKFAGVNYSKASEVANNKRNHTGGWVFIYEDR